MRAVIRTKPDGTEETYESCTDAAIATRKSVQAVAFSAMYGTRCGKDRYRYADGTPYRRRIRKKKYAKTTEPKTDGEIAMYLLADWYLHQTRWTLPGDMIVDISKYMKGRDGSAV